MSMLKPTQRGARLCLGRRNLHGWNIVASEARETESASQFQSMNPRSGEAMPTVFNNADAALVGEAMDSAAEAALALRKLPSKATSSFLRAAAAGIKNIEDDLVEMATSETGLPEGRIRNETARTVGQLSLFADVVDSGTWVDARIDTAPGKPDVRRMLMPLGPAVVFGASNFPLAFSVAGGDTASAFAAGNPVVVKAHPAHPGTSCLVGTALSNAVRSEGLPPGMFSMLHGNSPAVGEALVKHPAAQAVGFTGSLSAGRHLFDIASSRPSPIPVYAEMGSINPIVVMPSALSQQCEEIAAGLAGSVNMGAGQFCTSPGVVFLIESEEDSTLTSRFTQEFSRAMQQAPPQTMLTDAIRKGFSAGSDRLSSVSGVNLLAAPNASAEGGATNVTGGVLETDSATFRASKTLQEEVFGPLCVVVKCSSAQDLHDTVLTLEGQLTASVFHAGGPDLQDAAWHDVLGSLQEKVGRLIYNAYPTGVEVNYSMNHGGPYPATTAVGTTSVGADAIRRFARPICFQDCPQELLPMALQDANTSVCRLVNGQMVTA